jgi:hypothetical protein
MYVAIGAPWDNAFINAMALWNQSTPFRFTYFSEYSDPCSSNSTNGLSFSDSICGDAWNSSTLAVTLVYSRGNTLRELCDLQQQVEMERLMALGPLVVGQALKISSAWRYTNSVM